MGDLEAKALIDNSYMKHKDLWEAARLNAFYSVVPYSSKKIELNDIIKFNWDKEEANQIDENEIERLKQEAKKWERVI